MKFKIPFLILLFFISCNQPSQKSEGKEKLSKQKMVEVLLDVHLAEASYNAIDRTEKNSQQELLNQYSEIFKEHKISGNDFYDTYDYYLSHPDVMDSVYSELVSRITTLQGQLKQSLPKVPAQDTTAVRDSLKNQMLKRFKKHK